MAEKLSLAESKTIDLKELSATKKEAQEHEIINKHHEVKQLKIDKNYLEGLLDQRTRELNKAKKEKNEMQTDF
jgi:hypothetical protein